MYKLIEHASKHSYVCKSFLIFVIFNKKNVFKICQINEILRGYLFVNAQTQRTAAAKNI